MSYRIFMTISRGMTDKTLVCVFPWEKALMEEAHGEAAQVVTIDAMCNDDGVKSVRKVALKHASQGVKEAPSLRAQLEAMCVVEADEDPKNDLASEYGRMEQKYGMHPDVKMTVVSKVYGGPTAFAQAVRPFLGSKPPKGMAFPGDVGDEPAPREKPSTSKPVSEMGRKDLEAWLTKNGLEFEKGEKIEVLRDRVETASA